MSSSRRRNGMPASCEPCRRDKVRCDHKLPVCTRCQRRRTVNSCFYHPAPLTRRTILSPSPSVERHPELSRLVEVFDTPASIEPQHHQVLEIPSPLPLGYLGPTSFAAEFVANTGSSGGLETEAAVTEIDGSDRLQPYWFRKISEVLMLLEDLPFLERLVSDFYNLSPAPVIPAPFVQNAFPSTQKLCAEYLPGRVTRLASDIIDNTSRPFQIPSSTQGCDFHKLYTGVNCRLEILGIMISQAGRSTQYGMGTGAFTICGEPQTRTQFAQRMYSASDTIVQVCKMLTPTNDLQLWLVYENMALTDMIQGGSSEIIWSQLGDLSTRIYALGIHRDTKKSIDIPPFLSQMRKRLFAASYRVDKSIATFLGRPPRLSLKHSDCGLPLCIDDQIYGASNDVFVQAMKNVDEQGWSLKPVFQSVAWLRLRFSNAIFREEILDISLMPSEQKTVEQLRFVVPFQLPKIYILNQGLGTERDISRRCKETWESHPSYLRYTPQTDHDNVLIVYMLILAYLAYSYNEFLIQRLLVRQHQVPNTSLLSVSAQLISTILLLARDRGLTRNTYVVLTSSMQLYGFPAASVLIEVLQSETRSGIPVEYATPRAEIIRNLCVFVSHLDVEKPRNGCDALFKRAAKVFRGILDEVIESRSTSNDNRLPVSDSHDWVAAWNQDEIDVDLIGDGVQLENMDFGIMFDQWLI